MTEAVAWREYKAVLMSSEGSGTGLPRPETAGKSLHLMKPHFLSLRDGNKNTLTSQDH